jgi:hypothetical protein
MWQELFVIDFIQLAEGVITSARKADNTMLSR